MNDSTLAKAASAALEQATEVLGYIKENYPEVLQEALDATEK